MNTNKSQNCSSSGNVTGSLFGRLLSKPIYALLLLYYELVDSSSSMKDKSVILAAIAYFFLPFDLIPDIVPVLGITDDLTAVIVACRYVRMHQTPEVTSRARRKLAEIFR